MNKYQEALDCLKEIDCNSIRNCSCETCPMKSLCNHYHSCKTLQELVDKATPKKVLNIHKEYCFPGTYRLSGICPNCKVHVDESKYCSRCGQKLDWR